MAIPLTPIAPTPAARRMVRLDGRLLMRSLPGDRGAPIRADLCRILQATLQHRWEHTPPGDACLNAPCFAGLACSIWKYTSSGISSLELSGRHPITAQIARRIRGEHPRGHCADGAAGRPVRRPALGPDGERRSVGQRKACAMGAHSGTRGVIRRGVAPVDAWPVSRRRGGLARRAVGRRHALLLAPGMLLAVALSACADKPPPADVTPFAFPAVGAGQKDTAQFGARSGPTVP